MKVPVTHQTLILRIRRALQARGRDLRLTRGGERQRLLGRYFIIDGKRVVEHHVDIEKLARELKLLRPWETYTP